MLPLRLTPQAAVVLEEADRLAADASDQPAGTGHLLLALLGQDPVRDLLQEHGVTPAALERHLRRRGSLAEPAWGNLTAAGSARSRALETVLGLALGEALQWGEPSLTPQALLLAAARYTQCLASRVLADHGVRYADLRQQTRPLRAVAGEPRPTGQPSHAGPPRPSHEARLERIEDKLDELLGLLRRQP
jgi:ATP-dependent Clp protease ATP-binding subunit ClpA